MSLCREKKLLDRIRDTIRGKHYSIYTFCPAKPCRRPHANDGDRTVGSANEHQFAQDPCSSA